MLMRFTAVRQYSSCEAARWFRATDIPEIKPGIYDYKPVKKPSHFEVFSHKDSQRLENAYHNGTLDVPVETDGLFTVDLKKYLCRPTFWDGPAYTVRRSLWFEVLSNGKFVPVETELEQKIEAYYKTDRDSEVHIEWPTKDGVEEMSGKFSTDPKAINGEIPLLTLQNKDAWISAFTKRQLYRGTPRRKSLQSGDGSGLAKAGSAASEKKTSSSSSSSSSIESNDMKMRPEFKEREIKHLIFCVHGIGQLLSVKFEQINFVKDVDALRNIITSTYPKLRASSGSKLMPDDSGVQVLPVLWRQKINDRIRGLRPNQLFGTTNLAADAVLDYVLYTEPSQRKLIQTAAAEEMNRMFRLFCDMHPQFTENVKVSIIGHSLGSVIAYDLMNPDTAMADLEFPVANLFTLGSPVGVLDLIRQSNSIVKGRANSMYNIMRLADPVAARVEPLVTLDSLKVAPKPLPGGATNLLQQFREFTGDLASSSEYLTSKAFSLLHFFGSEENKAVTKKPQETAKSAHVDLQELKQFNRHGRLDFSVQESMDLSLLLGLAGHLMYLDNPDVVQFILKEVLEL